MHAKANEIVDRGREYVDRPYRHLGRSWKTGVDCAGLLICLMNDCDVSDFDSGAYSRRPNVIEFDRVMRESGCVRLPITELAHGDIIRMAIQRWPVHCALYENDGRGEFIIHAWLPFRKVVREPLTPARYATISSVWRFP